MRSILLIPLTALLTPFLVAAAEAPATKPAEGPRSVVYALSAGGSMLNQWADASDQALKAIGSLDAGTRFNVVVWTGQRAVTFRPTLQVAGRDSAAEVQKFLAGVSPGGGSDLGALIVGAVDLRAEVVWVGSNGSTPDPKKCLAQVAAVNKRAHCKINTTTLFARYAGVEDQSLLWRLAAENGGRCVDAKGRAIKTDPAAPAPPPSGPSIFK